MKSRPKDLDAILKARADVYAQRATYGDISPDGHIQVVIFSVGPQRIGMETRHIRSVIPIRSLFNIPKAFPNLIGVLHAESQLVSIFDTSSLLQIADVDVDQYSLAIVLKSDTLQVAFGCTEVINLVSISACDLMEQHTFLYEHQVTMLFNPHAFLAQLDQGR